MTVKNFRLVFTIVVMVLSAIMPSIASADIIDDITVHTDANDEVDMVVKFTVPIQYMRHFPQGKTDFTAISFNVLSSVPAADWQNYESHRAPPSDLVEDVLVSTIDRATGPQVQIKFKKTVDITVDLGRNGQSLVIHMKRLVTSSDAPSGNVIAPVIVLPPSAQKAVHIPLGGTDGLPVFPDIDQPVQQDSITASSTPTLAEQVLKANNQASAQMIQGGNALLTGQPFIAIDSFNGTLRLPPNKYTEDAQLWIAISKERSGQLPKAILEFQTYLKLYPNGKYAQWVKDRLALYKASQPALFQTSTNLLATPKPTQNTDLQYSEFGSLSMEAYTGASSTKTMATVGTTQIPTTISSTDQKSVMTNVTMTARANNNEYDNRLVFQDLYAANYLPGQMNTNRLGAAFYELKDRVENYSVKIGRQSGMGGGVMGRFDGVSAGYGFMNDYRVNVVAGQLSDMTLDEQPKFTGTSLDFGYKSPFGGSVYYIDQTVYGITDRKAIGGNLRYFESSFNVMSMLDYDLLFKALNFFTVQGTVSGGGKSNDYNFLVDRRRSPILDLRNAVSGSTVTFTSLIQQGMSTSDLVDWANARTTTTDSASAGMINHLSEKWIMGSDISFATTEAMAASGTSDPTTGVCIDVMVGCVAEVPSSGPSWSFSERLAGMGVFKPRDVTSLSVNYSQSETSKNKGLQLSNHSDIAEKWTLDSTMGATLQTDNTGGKTNSYSPSLRLSYRMKNYLTLDSQLGLTWSTTSSSSLQTGSRTFQDNISFGFRFDF